MIFRISAAVLALILAAVLMILFVTPGDEFHTMLNDDLKDSTTFELVGEYTGSSFEGSVLVSHTGSNTELTIVSQAVIPNISNCGVRWRRNSGNGRSLNPCGL